MMFHLVSVYGFTQIKSHSSTTEEEETKGKEGKISLVMCNLLAHWIDIVLGFCFVSIFFFCPAGHYVLQ